MMIDRRQLIAALAATAVVGPALAEQAVYECVAPGISAPERAVAFLEGWISEIEHRAAGDGHLEMFRFVMQQRGGGTEIEWRQTHPPQFDVGDDIELKIEGRAGLGPLDEITLYARKI